MTRIDILTQKVRDLYEEKNLNRADWADWMYQHHVFQVATTAKELAERFAVDAELAPAAGMLHDIADAVMNRFDSAHEAHSLQIAGELLTEAGFTPEQITIVVDDALTFHSCYGEDLPQTPVGKILATADAVVHLTTDFYYFAERQMQQSKTAKHIADWALPKIERDFYTKIFFEELRTEHRSDYESLRQHFTT